MPDLVPSYSQLPLLRATLDNGLRVVLHVDRRLPLLAVNLWYHVGSANEHPGRTGFAHLFEHMLFQGSEHVGTNDHFRHLQAVGGVANGSTWYDRTNYYETVPSNRLDLALWLESDRMGFLLPGLDQAKLDNQRDVVLNERRQRVDNRPYGRPYERLFELLMPPDHPYHWPVIGRVADLEAATLDDVHAFFRSWYSPNNAVLTLAGDFEPEHALERVRHWFDEIPRRDLPARPDLPLAPITTPIEETVSDRVQLPRVYMAFRTPPFGSDEWFAGALLSTLLGHGKSSPLYRDLVWERQVAQDTGAYVYPTMQAGVFVLWATGKAETTTESLAADLRRHLDAAARACDPREFERALRQSLTGLLGELETLDARADHLSMYATLFGRPEAAWEEPRRYADRKAEELTSFAERYLGPSRGVTLTVVPEEPAS